MGIPSRSVHAAFCDGANGRLVRARDRAAPGRQDHPALGHLHWAGESEVRADCRASDWAVDSQARRLEGARVSASISNERPAPDKVLADIADYALDYKIDSDLAYTTARHCLMDTLGLRPRGARISGLHQAARPHRARHGRSQRRARSRHKLSSSIPCRPHSTSAP